MVSPGENGGCGNPADLGQPGKTTFIVYTESQLNGDGNYIHYLIYNSKQNPLAYYFGFEDKWRGGDNDFEDMAIKVTGLIKPCEPTQEVCDGYDNNCDGLIDNEPVDVGQACTTTAGNHPGVGPCQAGVTVCASSGPGDTTTQCVGEVGPSVEVCNTIDDDCNGLVDDSPTDPELGQACGATDEGECAFGHNQCVVGVITCLGAQGPSPEFCNGLDDDCDGVVDGTVTPASASCTTDADCDAQAPFCLPSSSGTSVCARGPLDAVGNCVVSGSTCPGVRRCEVGTIVCAEGTAGVPEVCDGADNNCNGLIDEGDPGGGAECAPAGADGQPITLEMARTGQCLPGTEHCVGGQLKCVGGRGPTQEICDGLDNDCDGQTDVAAACPGETMCIEGKCAEPCRTGEFPCPAGLVCEQGYCVKAGGQGGSGGSGGALPDAGTDKDASAGDAGSSDAGTSSNDASAGVAGSGTGQHPARSDNYGLVTGGGGASCAMGPQAWKWQHAALMLLACGWLARRFGRQGSER